LRIGANVPKLWRSETRLRNDPTRLGRFNGIGNPMALRQSLLQALAHHGPPVHQLVTVMLARRADWS
jgi:hypothetical protein